MTASIPYWNKTEFLKASIRAKKSLKASFSSGTDGDRQPELWLLPSHLISALLKAVGCEADDCTEKIIMIGGLNCIINYLSTSSLQVG